MAFAKALALQNMIKWLVIGVVAIIFMAIFFWQFGQFLIPLMLAGFVAFVLYVQSAQTKKPASPTSMVLMVVLPLGAFMFGYFIQRGSTVALSGSGYPADPTTLIIDQTMSIMLLVFILVVALVFAVSRRRRR